MTAQQGLSDWDDIFPPTRIVISVDANQQTGAIDHISTVVHELLHIVFRPMYLGWVDDKLEEIGILAYDHALTEYIRKSPKRLQVWTETIDAKLKEMDS